MTQDQINAFMNEYQALCQKHGMHLVAADDDEMQLYNNDDDFIGDVDQSTYTAELYVPPVRVPRPARPANEPMLDISGMHEVLKGFYLEGLTNVLNQESEALKKLK